MNLTKLRNSDVCECGNVLTISDCKKPLIKHGLKNFYGGQSKYVMLCICPKCEQDYYALLRAQNNTYKIINTVKKTLDLAPADLDEYKRNDLVQLAKERNVEGKYWQLKMPELLEAVKNTYELAE